MFDAGAGTVGARDYFGHAASAEDDIEALGVPIASSTPKPLAVRP